MTLPNHGLEGSLRTLLILSSNSLLKIIVLKFRVYGKNQLDKSLEDTEVFGNRYHLYCRHARRTELRNSHVLEKR